MKKFRVGTKVSAEITSSHTWRSDIGTIDVGTRLIKLAKVKQLYPSGAILIVDSSDPKLPPQHYTVVPRALKRIPKRTRK